MKKTFTINISGSVFHIDEDAYEKLQSYLQMLSGHFGTSTEGREILQDIEARIAELFSEKMQAEEKNVVIVPWVDDVIARMGKPEDFLEGEEEEEEATEEKTVSSTSKVRRRMYRDPDHRVLGGVCSGMAAYFRIDVVVMRIIFILLFFLLGPFNILIYLILWIAVPKARTTSQRLEMRGEEATVSNIEKSFKEEVKEVKDSYKKFRNSETYEKGKDSMARFGDLFYNIVRVVLKALVVVIGVLMIVGGFLGLISFLTSLIVGNSVLDGATWLPGFSPEFHIPGFFHHFVSPTTVTLSLISIGLLVTIPLLTILFVGTKLVFRYKTNNKMIGLGAVGVWLIALVMIIILSISQVDNFSKQTKMTTNQTIECTNCQTLYLELGDDLYKNYTDFEISLDNMQVIVVDGEEVLLGTPRLDVEKSNNDDFVVLIRKKSRGSSQQDAREQIENIEYKFNQKDSTIYFDPYFVLNENGKWRDQEINITVKVPEGKSIYLGEKMVKIIYDIENTSNTWDGDMVGKYWKMTDFGLEMDKTR